MSELKGQLLGVILVLSLFGIVAGAMRTTVNKYANTIETTVDDIAEGTNA